MKQAFQLKNAVLLMALAAAYPLQAHALAGVAQFTAGEVNVRQTDGRTTALAKGSNIDNGQAIVTGTNGRAQVRFTDGGLISLQPNTEFKIANYVDQNDPKEDRFLVDLLRGSMRAITGLIGKRNRDNYKLTTTTATIGIRGSGFKVGYNPDGSLSISSELDKIEVCNQSGCMGLVAGESVRVVDNATPPVRTSHPPKVETPRTEPDPVVVGNKVDEEGKAQIIQDQAASVNTGSFNLALAAHYHAPPVTSDPSGTTLLPTSLSQVELDAGKVTQFADPNYLFKPVTGSGAGSIGSVTAGDFVGWGSWASATKDSVTSPGSPSALTQLHYVVGQPTAVMPTTGASATYSLVGGSVPTTYTGTSGVLQSGSLVVNFGSLSLDAFINTTLGNISVTGAYISGSSFSGSGTGSVHGFFAGPDANRAGLVYTGNLSPAGTFSGAAAFQR